MFGGLKKFSLIATTIRFSGSLIERDLGTFLAVHSKVLMPRVVVDAVFVEHFNRYHYTFLTVCFLSKGSLHASSVIAQILFFNSDTFSVSAEQECLLKMG